MYLLVEDFRNGLDVRKHISTSPPGTLQRLVNAHITRGGEIEKRKAFAEYAALPAGTFGLGAVSGQIYTFGSAAPPTMPAGVSYMQLTARSGAAMVDVLDVELYAGKLYVVAEFADGSVDHFYDGAVVPDADWTFTAARSLTATTIRQKVYSVRNSTLFFSGLSAPNKWGTGVTGSNFIDMAEYLPNALDLRATSSYQDRLAVFARSDTLIWALDPDPAKNVLAQMLPGIGCLAPRSATPYGQEDVFFLADSGVRSLRARDSSNAASVSDVGTPIDDLVTQSIRELGEAQAYNAVSVVEPEDGRYWLALGSTIYVFSFFRTSKIAAWSTYNPGFDVDDMVVTGGRVYVRSNDTLYLYGGADNATYDSSEVEVVLPYMDGQQPATRKYLTGLDVSSVGAWSVHCGVDSNTPEVRELLSTLEGVTYHEMRYTAALDSTHFGLRLVNKESGYSRLNNVVVHFDVGDAG